MKISFHDKGQNKAMEFFEKIYGKELEIANLELGKAILKKKLDEVIINYNYESLEKLISSICSGYNALPVLDQKTKYGVFERVEIIYVDYLLNNEQIDLLISKIEIEKAKTNCHLSNDLELKDAIDNFIKNM